MKVYRVKVEQWWAGM